MEDFQYSINERDHFEILENISTPSTSSRDKEKKNGKHWESRRKKEKGVELHEDMTSVASSRETLEPILNSPFSPNMQLNILNILSQHIPELEKYKHAENPLTMLLASAGDTDRKSESRTETASESSSDHNFLIHMVKLLMDMNMASKADIDKKYFPSEQEIHTDAVRLGVDAVHKPVLAKESLSVKLRESYIFGQDTEGCKCNFNDRNRIQLLNISTPPAIPSTFSNHKEVEHRKHWEDSRNDEKEEAEDHGDMSSMASSRETLEPILNSPFSPNMQGNILNILCQHIPELEKYKHADHPLTMLLASEGDADRKSESRTETASEPNGDHNIMIHMVKLLLDVNMSSKEHLDEKYFPSEQEIDRDAAHLGVDPECNPVLDKESLSVKLPEGYIFGQDMEGYTCNFNERKHIQLLNNIPNPPAIPSILSSHIEDENGKHCEDSRKEEEEGAEDLGDMCGVAFSRETLQPILSSPFSPSTQWNILNILSLHIPELEKYKHAEHPLTMLLASGEDISRKSESRKEEYTERFDSETNVDGDAKTASRSSGDHNILIHMVKLLLDVHEKKVEEEETWNKEEEEIKEEGVKMVLDQIEEHRRSHQPINIPFFDVFLRNLCPGSSVELKEDKCWEKVEVSSNHNQAYKLTDKNPKTYWQSNDITGCHFINIYMRKGIVIRQLAVLVTNKNLYHMPADIVVLGGDDPTNINTELNAINVPCSASRVVLLENMSRFWSIIQIKIKKCQQCVYNTRVYGLEVLGPRPMFWPVFKQQLCCRTHLFYTTKAHTWCQGIQGDKHQLLQLFNKLNSALRHEQMFADRFLSNAEAAEALGRTCWEALITPIVQSITVSETVSPLSWLFNEYLENLELLKRDKRGAAIFNSCVRRLTHLLGHVDNSRVDIEGLKLLIKFNRKEEKNKEPSASATAKLYMKNTSSIAGIALCWQGVVQLQVKRFLDVTYKLPNFVECYRNMYFRLKNSTEELFGLRTTFVFALREGFSAALLQLPFLTSIHVSERFAQYIDHMIQESRVSSGNVETLSKLQQLLEPILFLSRLETFEHFYSHYLGDRLLSQGNVWLENAVIEQIGPCFPSCFPQQMISDLHVSEELQQEFNLYQLLKINKNLQEMNEVKMNKQLSEPEVESEVKVLMLSPECWAISASCYLEEPSNYFPHQLCTYLAEFTDFYTNSQRMYSLSNSKLRRVQWTWLGHAELCYGSCTLSVSTLQMYILLQFNQQQTVNAEALQPVTGLSPTVLAQTLKPLTEKGILTHTGYIQDPLEDGHITGVLKLNEQWVAQSLERESYCYLLPKQTYLDLNKDTAHMLGRNAELYVAT